jgi:hypothetical protein
LPSRVLTVEFRGPYADDEKNLSDRLDAHVSTVVRA